MRQLTFDQWCARNPSLTNCTSCQGHGVNRAEKPCRACQGTGHNIAAQGLYEAAIDADRRLLARLTGLDFSHYKPQY